VNTHAHIPTHLVQPDVPCRVKFLISGHGPTDRSHVSPHTLRFPRADPGRTVVGHDQLTAPHTATSALMHNVRDFKLWVRNVRVSPVLAPSMRFLFVSDQCARRGQVPTEEISTESALLVHADALCRPSGGPPAQHPFSARRAWWDRARTCGRRRIFVDLSEGTDLTHIPFTFK
jgi:hypothetical protein